MKNRNTMLTTVVFLVVCFWPSPTAQAVVPAPDGGYPGANTAEGQNALLSLTSGIYNTAVGSLSLRALTEGQLNTAIGAGALLANTADQNTATGAGALLSNTAGFGNTANGAFALFSNTEGYGNTAIGTSTLYNNTTGDENTAVADGALFLNTSGNFNTGTGRSALFSNTTGDDNTATGDDALAYNITGSDNTATGFFALYFNTTGNANTATGDAALLNNTTGSDNVALGFNAGESQTTGSNNVYIGAGLVGVAGESNACYIRSIFGQTSGGGAPVLINATGKLGTTTSSKRFKEEIKPMDKASEVLLALEPVTFRYRKELDPSGTRQFGLVAEDVEKADPDLIVRDKDGKPYTVRYDAVNAMLLNEFLKEHRKVEELQGAVLQQEKSFQSRLEQQEQQIQALTSSLRKVSARLAKSKPAPQLVLNSP
jgi:Chaperone of endosialidase